MHLRRSPSKVTLCGLRFRGVFFSRFISFQVWPSASASRLDGAAPRAGERGRTESVLLGVRTVAY